MRAIVDDHGPGLRIDEVLYAYAFEDFCECDSSKGHRADLRVRCLGFEEDRAWQQGTVEHGIMKHEHIPLPESPPDFLETQNPRVGIKGTKPQGIVHGMHATQMTLLPFVEKGVGRVHRGFYKFRIVALAWIKDKVHLKWKWISGPPPTMCCGSTSR